MSLLPCLDVAPSLHVCKAEASLSQPHVSPQSNEKLKNVFMMVPISANTTAGCRLNRSSRVGSDPHFFAQISRPPPRITYGKRENRLLPLPGKQFRSDAYSIPSDDNRPDQEQEGRTELPFQVNEEPSSSEESGLFDDDQSPLQTPARDDWSAPFRSVTAMSTARKKRGLAKPLQTPKPKPVYPRESPRRDKRKTISDPISKSIGRRKENEATESKAKPTTNQRRLPVNELFLVSSPVDYTVEADPQSSCNGIQGQDPINDESSSPCQRNGSLVLFDNANVRRNRTTEQLTALGERLRRPSSRQKSVAALRKRHARRKNPIVTSFVESRGCDGFEISELAVGSHLKKKQPSKGHSPLVQGLAPLQLQGGPLPEVDFGPSATELKMETQNNDEFKGYINAAERNGLEAPEHASTEQSSERVTFSDATRESLIRSQLASISAPERIPSESEESEEDSQGDIDSEAEPNSSEYGKLIERPSVRRTPTPASPARDSRPVVNANLSSKHKTRHIGQFDDVNHGMTLDFRQRGVPGQRPRTCGRRHLVEVNDTIVEVRESDCLPGNYSLSNNRLRQVSGADKDHAPQQRRRSILKSSGQVIPDSTTMPEATEANTRRNGLIDNSTSGYFANAINLLGEPVGVEHKIIPRRSSYINQTDVEVCDSERAIPETSLEPPDYTSASNLGILRSNSSGMWTSSSGLPYAPKDLGSLTKSVSREHGTLSQSVRRRPSLCFHTPARVR